MSTVDIDRAVELTRDRETEQVHGGEGEPTITTEFEHVPERCIALELAEEFAALLDDNKFSGLICQQVNTNGRRK